MVFLLSILSIVFCAFSSVFQKKYEQRQEAPAGLRILFWQGVFCLLVMAGLYALGLSESGAPPWKILSDEPLVIFYALLVSLFNFLFALTVYFIPSSLAEAISGGAFIPIFLGMLVINLTSGNFRGVEDLLNPWKLLVLLITVTSVIVLPLTEDKNEKEKRGNWGLSKRRFFTVGIVLAVLATVCDALSSLIADYSMSSEASESVDFMIGTAFIESVIGVVSLAGLCIREKGRPALLSKENRYPVWAEAFGTFSMLLYCIAAMYDAVLGEIIWISYPAVFLIFSVIFLKEKLNSRQKGLLAVILVSDVLFYALDWLI